MGQASGPSGENPSGTVEWTGGHENTFFSDRLDVTCVVVDGREATIGGTGTEFFSRIEGQIAALVHIVDGGGPAAGQDLFEVTTIDFRSPTSLPRRRLTAPRSGPAPGGSATISGIWSCVTLNRCPR